MELAEFCPDGAGDSGVTLPVNEDHRLFALTVDPDDTHFLVSLRGVFDPGAGTFGVEVIACHHAVFCIVVADKGHIFHNVGTVFHSSGRTVSQGILRGCDCAFVCKADKGFHKIRGGVAVGAVDKDVLHSDSGSLRNGLAHRQRFRFLHVFTIVGKKQNGVVGFVCKGDAGDVEFVEYTDGHTHIAVALHAHGVVRGYICSAVADSKLPLPGRRAFFHVFFTGIASHKTQRQQNGQC